MLTRHRTLLRRVATGGAALVGLLYLLIGLDIITVMDDQANASPAPPLIAAVLFLALAAALRFDRRGVYLAGAALQVIVIVMYFVVAPERTPSFEAWGGTLKVLQVALLIAFAWLIVSSTGRATDRPPTPDPAATAQQ